jgi:L-lactate dehydrogenase complex protein LldG
MNLERLLSAGVFGGPRDRAPRFARSAGRTDVARICGESPADTVRRGNPRPGVAYIDFLWLPTAQYPSHIDMPDLAATFEQRATETAATVWRCERSPLAVRSAVERAAENARSIVLSEAEFLAPQLLAALRGLAGVILRPDDEQLAAAEVGVTEAFAGVASTGSVCIAMGRPLVAATSLLMPLNIVLLASERIVERPRDLFDSQCLKGEGLKRNLVFITGPSATADMGPLVRGVHGPHRLQILLLE